MVIFQKIALKYTEIFSAISISKTYLVGRSNWNRSVTGTKKLVGIWI